jgi:hypothetical protein
MNDSFLPIFSGGTGRSGTTIVGKLLGRHSKIKCGKPYEIKFLTDVFSLTDLAFGMRDFSSQEISKKSRLYLHFMPLGKYEPRLKKFSGKMLNEWYERKNRLDQDSGLHLGISKKKIKILLRELHDGASQDLEGASRQFFYGFVNAQRQYLGEPNWMDTSPPNIMHASSIYRLLPGAKFIEMQRNPLDTIASVIREPWGPNDFDSAMAWWLRRTSMAEASMVQIPEEQKFILKLEDLIIHDRENSYAKLLDFLNIKDEEIIRNFFDKEMLAEKLHENRWRRDFPNPEEIEERFEQATGVRLTGK